MAGSLTIEPRDEGSFAISGELDVTTVEAFEAIRLPPPGAEQVVTLDLSGVTFVDSSGIRALLQLARQLEEGTLVFARPSRPVQVVLRLIDAAHLPGVVIEPGEDPDSA